MKESWSLFNVPYSTACLQQGCLRGACHRSAQQSQLAHKILTSPTPPPPPQAQASQGPKLEQPTIDVGISIEE